MKFARIFVRMRMKKFEKLKIMKIERLKINLKNENFQRIVDEDGAIV